jgi:hypothetical protein
MSGAEPMVRRFPDPPDAVRDALDLLQVAEDEDSEGVVRVEDVAGMPRPWVPDACPADLRTAVWQWCDAVAAWLNREYAWRPDQLIPACWPRHAHLAHELAVLAVLRWRAQRSVQPEAMEDWHRNAYPMFCDRMSERLGESACRTGTHVDWPAESRYVVFTAPDRELERWEVIAADGRCR